jgi:hypothetical protein
LRENSARRIRKAGAPRLVILAPLFFLSLFALISSHAATAVAFDSSEALELRKSELEQARASLKEELAAISAEQKSCDKALKAKPWLIAGTALGIAGTIGGAVAVGVQAKQIKDKKSELNEINGGI